MERAGGHTLAAAVTQLLVEHQESFGPDGQSTFLARFDTLFAERTDDRFGDVRLVGLEFELNPQTARCVIKLR